MATYVIGDVQGCFNELQALLQQIQFNPAQDVLWFTGDLVNRGKQSLETLRFIKNLGDKHIVVLGNHDLHLLAVNYDESRRKKNDTLHNVLQASDKAQLMEWLRQQPLIHHDKNFNAILVHAGIPPTWTLQQAVERAQEVEEVLKGDNPEEFLKQMHGNEPNLWEDHLSGSHRWRCIINYLTRMRFCHADGSLDLTYKGTIAEKPTQLIPWFTFPKRIPVSEKIIFGHWAALNGETHSPMLCALDTGCVWGNSLTAMRLEDSKRFSTQCLSF